jgi:putative serine/threonine protein kinase
LQAIHSERATLDQLVRTPYVQILTYPKISLRVARSRIKQLELLGVESLSFEGRARIGRLGLLGIGTVGIVVKCTAGGADYALKIRRTDANRPSMAEEYKLTSFANKLGIGATLYRHTKDFLLMKFLDYIEFSDWIKQVRGEGTRMRVRAMVHEILNQCRKLDIMGLDHGQLSNLRKHVVVAEGRPWIIDFESASRSRRPSNVTSAAQYLLVGGRISPFTRRMLGVRDTGQVLKLLHEYKRGYDDFTYAKLLEQLKLGPT